MPSRAFAIGAHPDDIEFGMAGTLLRLRDAGYAIHCMNLADGCCGSVTLDRAAAAATRLEESQAACARVGATFHPPLVHDLEVFYDKPTLARLAAVVREVAPRILLVPSPQDYMEDHQNACRLAVSAAFCRGMPNFPTDPPVPPVSETVTVYHAQPHGHRDGLNRPVRPDLFVDVGEVLEEKVAMLAEHRSQKEWLDESQGMDAYLETARDLAREAGGLSGRFAYAEGWRRHNPLGLCGAGDDPLADDLDESLVCSATAADSDSTGDAS